MFAKVSVLVPTRRRVGRLDTLLASYEDTTRGYESSSELVFRVDDDDLDTQDFLLCQKRKMVIGPRYQGYDSMPVFFNEAAAESTGDVLMLGNDDMVFRTPGWAVRILEEANKFLDGMFILGVRTLNEGHYPFAAVSRLVVDRLGFIADPRLFWIDVYLRDIMTHFDRCVVLPNVRIDHEWMGFHPDGVFSEGTRDIVSQDPTYWEKRHTPAVAEAIARLSEVLV